MEMKLKWLGPIFSATLEFKSCSCLAQLYQKVLDKEHVECANQTATKSTELQLDDKSLPLSLETYMSNIVNIVHLFFINLCFESILQPFNGAKGLPNMHHMISGSLLVHSK